MKFHTLTDEQRYIKECIFRGDSPQEIADSMGDDLVREREFYSRCVRLRESKAERLRLEESEPLYEGEEDFLRKSSAVCRLLENKAHEDSRYVRGLKDLGLPVPGSN